MPAMVDPLRALGSLVQAGRPRLVVEGAVGDLAPLVLGGVAEASRSPDDRGPVVFVCKDDPRAREVVDALQVLWWPASGGDAPLEPPPALWVPAVDVSPYVDLAPDRSLLMARQALLFRLLQDLAPQVLVLSVPALLRKVIPPDAFDARCDLVVQGQTIDREAFAETLVRAGFGRMPVVEDPGAFTLRGGVVDFYPPVYRDPIRLELDGDEVASIRLYDPATQRTLRTVDHAYLHPVRETLVSEGARPEERLLDLADRARHPSSHTRFVLSQIAEGAEFFGADALVPIFHAEMASLLAYLPAGARVVLEEPAELFAEADRFLSRLHGAYQERIDAHQLAVRPEDLFLRPEKLKTRLQSAPWVELTTVSSPADAPAGVAGDDAAEVSSVTLRAEPYTELTYEVQRRKAEPGQRLLEPVAKEVRNAFTSGSRVLLVSPDHGAADRLGGLLARYGVTARVSSPRVGYDLPLGATAGDPLAVPSSPLSAQAERRLDQTAEASLGSPETVEVEVRIGRLPRGFRLPAARLAVLSEEELFGAKVRRARRRSPPAASRIGDLSELDLGDLVVHEIHGVGRFEGLRREEAGGVVGDFMLLTYRGDARLFLPVHRFQEVHRYVGAEGGGLRLDRLGGSTWQTRRRKVEQNVRQLAEELLQLYAQREALSGKAAAPPDELYRAFEATFPFTETSDQQAAIEAVLEDLMASRPMDRLVCGDVGYGKTEVALRAAMLAVLDGRQVAMLAPTTVLVEQHLTTFGERLRSFPVRVEGLSRFRTRKAQQRVLAEVAAGEVDIVIGTHRLLSKDVHFARLGLVIVDEEQRFGVAHKERLKQLRSLVDVLTLTATPIPRTLHMALLGMRDLSLISTPPSDRLAVRTWVAVSSPQTIREAIARERARGGQVYFVVPRIGAEGGGLGQRGDRSLSEWAEELRRLVPEARVAEAHGQMDSRALERVMAEFVAGRHDVLVCTSIIESGLDITRANTLLVQDADRFGLAQLYQLRGRIGRGRERAYCLFMVSSLSAITPEARQRLEALQRFSDLGAGFNLASTDLEIRGTGDLLGGRQSGSIAQVGFAEYTRIMEEAVAELRGEPLHQERDPDLVSDLPSFIPDDYMEEPTHRLGFYRRFAEIRSQGEAEALLEELGDRFGTPPGQVLLLADLMVVKALARRLAARAVELTGRRLVLLLDEDTRLDPAYVRDLVAPRRSPWRFSPDFRLSRSLESTDAADRLVEAKNCLRELQAGVTEDARNA